ncbi:hypothetical protein AB0G02_40950 [Actinosynnema sp. NPDC023658]
MTLHCSDEDDRLEVATLLTAPAPRCTRADRRGCSTRWGAATAG